MIEFNNILTLNKEIIILKRNSHIKNHLLLINF